MSDEALNAQWKFNENLPNKIEEAAREAFRGVSSSAVLNMGNKYNWRNLKDGWYAGLQIGKVTSEDQFGEVQTWEVQLHEAGGIMISCEGASRWQIRISTVD